MRLLRLVILIGLAGSLIGCGPKKGDPAAKDAKGSKSGVQAGKEAGKKDPAGKPEVKPEPKVIPPAVDPPVVDPPEPAPPVPPVNPDPTVDLPPDKPMPVVPPETSPPVKEEGAESKPAGGRAIHLKNTDSGKTVSAGVGDLVILDLESNPSTGFEWEPGPGMKDSVLVLKSKKFEILSQRYPEIPPAIGQGGFTTFTYQVAGTGKATISLAYRRPGEKDAVSAKTFEVSIEAAKTTSPVVTGKIVFNVEPDVEKISGIVVSIRNTALADGPAPLIGTVELKPPFKLPITFAVPYDPAKVQPHPMFYSISVRVNTVVEGSEKLYYINDTHHPVFSDANDTKCDVAVKKLR